MDSEQLGRAIAQYLKDSGISQIFLSKKTGISASKLSQSLNGKRRLTFNEYCLICGALSVNTDKFLKPKIPDGKDG